MKLQLFSTGKNSRHRPIHCLPIWPAAVFPALLLTMSSPIWISMITAYGIRARRTTCVPAETAWPTAVCTMAICWLWTVLKSRGTAISLSPAYRGVYGETASADAATDAAAHECLPGHRRFILIPTSWISLALSRISSTARGRCTDVCPGRCEQLLCQL
jgi:hypothetical protein